MKHCELCNRSMDSMARPSLLYELQTDSVCNWHLQSKYNLVWCRTWWWKVRSTTSSSSSGKASKGWWVVWSDRANCPAVLLTECLVQLPSQDLLIYNPHHHHSCFECLKLDVMVSPLNCFYQRFVTYLVWRSLKRPIQVTLLNSELAVRSSHDITLSALRTTERLKFWGPSSAL